MRFAVPLLALLAVGCSQASKDAHTEHTPPATPPAASAETPSGRMHAMMTQPMQNMETTGNVDRDFATMMAEHHQQGIDMAKVELEHGSNARLKEIAQSIVDTQQMEKDRLLQIADGLPKEGSNQAASDQLHLSMMAGMDSLEVTGDTDRDFANLMAVHHQMAIDMAKIEIEHGKNEELLAMAKQIMEDQTKEAEELRSLGGGTKSP